MKQDSNQGRREVGTRNAGFAKKFAKTLASLNITPNQISTLSMVFAAGATFTFCEARENPTLLILAVAFIQLRLLCNLFDGMLAIEHHKKSKVGDLYNEVPDRISDALILMGAGLYSQQYPHAMDLAWAAVFVSTLTAYVRTFGASLVQKHYFIGPMAKQHRMFMVSLTSLLSLFVEQALYYGLIVVLVGAVITTLRRLRFIARDLKKA